MSALVDSLVACGYAGPVRLFAEREASQVLEACRAPHPPCWFKGLATVSPAAAAVATAPAVVDLLREALGDDVILWGAHLLSRGPGDVHPWHTDMETADPTGRTVSVWVAMEGGGDGSGMRFVAGSHRLGVSVQQARSEAGVSRSGATDDVILRLARGRAPAADIGEVCATDGEAVLFDGRTWHASRNDTGATRTALILQYAAADCPMRKADLGHLEWPFRYRGPAPCLLISGSAPVGVNTIGEAPR
jgi:ectoine hydroxylase-related dioxygenase (phytanoyl-CoA dioxygenase family)